MLEPLWQGKPILMSLVWGRILSIRGLVLSGIPVKIGANIFLQAAVLVGVPSQLPQANVMRG